MAYTTKAKIESLTGQTVNADLAAMVIAWVTDWINKYTGQNFEAGVGTRYYDLEGTEQVYIDNFSGTPTEVQILNPDGSIERTLTVDEDYFVGPFNTGTKNFLRMAENGWRRTFPYRGRALKVTANFGAAVPPAIEMVATKLASGLSVDLAGKDIQSESLGDYSVTYTAVDEKASELGVLSTLDMYREIEI